MQEAEIAGFSYFFEITTKESLDQVRVVFEEAIRRGLAARESRESQKKDLKLFENVRNAVHVLQPPAGNRLLVLLSHCFLNYPN